MAQAGNMAHLVWMLRRLRSMSVVEVAHRVVERSRRKLSRWRTPDFTALAGQGDDLPSLPGLADGVAAFRDDESLLQQWQNLAEAVAANRYRLLGQEWLAVDGLPDWSLDPQTGRHWPADAYCFDIGYRHAGDIGDVKYVLELNRLQYLQPLAALARLRGDETLADLVLAHVANWIEVNPPFRGVAWASGIELALRAVSLIVVTSLLGNRISPDLAHRLCKTLAAHGYWIDRFPSRHSSANNHLIAEAGALYLIGALAPGLVDAARWRRRGREVLIAESQRQILPDGIGAEQSPTYAAFTLEWLLLAAVVAERLGEPFPQTVALRLSAGGEALRAMTDAGGHQPHIGDDDEGRVLASGFAEPGYINGVLDALAGWFDDSDLASPASCAHFRQALFGRPPTASPLPRGVRHFPDGGYTVSRQTDQRGREWLVAFDHGPLGYLSIAAHGHADALSVWLHVGGRPVLVDAGTFGYHGASDWRDHFRGTPAHNTLSIAGEDSSIIAGPFNWGARAGCHVLDLQDSPSAWAVTAEHDGYIRRFGVRHRRRVAADNGGIVIADELIGGGRPLPAEIGFLFAPDLVLTHIADNAWRIDDGNQVLLTLRYDGPLTVRVDEGRDDPRRGWYSPHFGNRRPAPRLTFAGALAPNTAVRTLLLPATE